MGVERKLLEFEPKDKAPTSMGGVVDFLNHQEFDPTRQFYRLRILERVMADEIVALLGLPYEVALTKDDDALILSTGEAHWTGNEDDLIKRRAESAVYLHTHPHKTDSGLPINTPTVGDIRLTEYRKNKPSVLAHRGGVLVFRRPDLTSIDMKSPEARDALWEHSENTQVDMFGWSNQTIPTKLHDLPHDEQLAFVRGFAEEWGMIITEALFDNKQRVQEVLDEYINI